MPDNIFKFAKRLYHLKKRPKGVGFVTPEQEAWLRIHKPEVAEAMYEMYGHAPGWEEWSRLHWKKRRKRI